MAATIPTSQTAALLENPGSEARVAIRNAVPVQSPGRNQILVKLFCTGICASEVRALLGWGSYNSIAGHEGVGIVVQAGEDVSPTMINTRVGVKWLHSACGSCSLCTRGYSHHCPEQENTGRTVPGTLQQYVVADARYITKIPEALPSEVAAPLLCAGLTMAGALSKLDQHLCSGDWLVILGSGGGLGHVGVQIASKLHRYRVIAVDSGEAKRQLSLDAGAEAFVDYAQEDVEAQVKGLTGEGAHGIIVVPGAKEAFAISPKLVRNMGMIICVGLPPLDMALPISATVCAARGLTIVGSSVGTEKQMEELLEQAVAGIIKPKIEVLDFSECARVFEELKSGNITGRIVVKIPQ